MLNLTKSQAKKYAPEIRVNALCPALLDFRDEDEAAYRERAIAKSALKIVPGFDVAIEAIAIFNRIATPELNPSTRRWPSTRNALMIQVPTTVAADVRRALDEDIRTGDVTADLIPADADGQASLMTRDPMVIAGIPYAEEVFRQLDSRVGIDWLVNEGDHIEANTQLARFTGPARALLTGERTALNFIQMLSAVASRKGIVQWCQSISWYLTNDIRN